MFKKKLTGKDLIEHNIMLFTEASKNIAKGKQDVINEQNLLLKKEKDLLKEQRRLEKERADLTHFVDKADMICHNLKLLTTKKLK